MRAQFNKVGAGSGYHLILHPNVATGGHDQRSPEPGNADGEPAGGDLPDDQHQLVVGPDQQPGDNRPTPRTSPIYLSNDVLLVQGGGCCVIGYHGTRAAGNGGGNGGSNGNAVVQTFAWGVVGAPWHVPPSSGLAEPDRLGAAGHPRASATRLPSGPTTPSSTTPCSHG